MDYKQRMVGVKAFVFDVDGVFTNGSVLLHPSGAFIRMMNIKDGYAVQHAVKMGFAVGIITGGRSRMVKKRFAYLGVKDIYMGSSSKKEAFEDFLNKHGLKPGDALYMGDDLPDYEVMKMAGLPVCPADAAEEIKQLSMYISPVRGGEGCVRDVIEQVMKIHGRWMNDFAFVW